MTRYTLLFAALSFVVAYSGGLAATRITERGRNWLTVSLGFGGGFLLAVALSDIIPEAARQSKNAHIAVALGIAFFFLIEQYVDTHFCPAGEASCDKGHDHTTTGFLAAVGMGMHGLIDGIAVAGALVADFRLAMIVSAAVLIHKIPDGFCLGALLSAKGYGKARIHRYLTIFALTTPLGVLAAHYLLIDKLNPGLALGLSAGSFIYIATSHLLPEARESKSSGGLLAISVLAGVALAVLMPAA